MRLVIISAAALLLAGAASAQQILQLQSSRTPEQREAAFKAADANKDGKLDPKEFKAAMDPAILAQIPEADIPRIMAARDADNDGFISHAEFTTPGRVELHQ